MPITMSHRSPAPPAAKPPQPGVKPAAAATTDRPAVNAVSHPPDERDAARWAAVQQRSATADGEFVYAVRTTGVYCRPSCPSRAAKRENVQFHASGADALRAGFRPCKRCDPDGPGRAAQQAEAVARACRQIEDSAEALSLQALADAAGLSPYHFHRLFKSITGITPKAYASAHRARQLTNRLAHLDTTVTEAIYDAGFNSSGRFYATSTERLGMTPSRYRAKGADVEIRFAVGQCSLGAILVAASRQGICAISLGDDPQTLVQELQDRFARAELVGGDAGFEAMVAQVVGAIEAPGTGTDLPLDVRGTAFQQRVWQALRDIPAGQTATYSEIAERVGAPKSVRAVAQACGANTLAVAIPCHRVVRQDGALAGYRWGIERKQALLQREKP